MQLYIDTANIEEIREVSEWGILSGVTTNPSLLAREGRDVAGVIEEIAGLVSGPISVEAVSTRAEDMVAEARELVKLGDNVVVKIPMIPEGLKAVSRLSAEGIHCNVTLVFSAGQALMAGRAGAAFVSPFVGRLDDIGADGIGVVGDVVEVFAYHDIETSVIAASLRHPKHVTEAALVGSDIATVPYGVLQSMVSHPLTDTGLERFLNDWNSLQRAVKPGT
ncbi:MAG: fructose-6-phosphate aldolase [Bacillota bacterium]